MLVFFPHYEIFDLLVKTAAGTPTWTPASDPPPRGGDAIRQVSAQEGHYCAPQHPLEDVSPPGHANTSRTMLCSHCRLPNTPRPDWGLWGAWRGHQGPSPLAREGVSVRTTAQRAQSHEKLARNCLPPKEKNINNFLKKRE